MIKAYVTCISTYYEGEDIEIRYSIFKDDELIQKESFYEDYQKPALCGLISVKRLLKDLENFIDEEIVIIVNDGSLFEILNNTSRTPKQEVQDLGRQVRTIMNKFHNIRIENVSGDHLEIEKWNNILSP